MAEPDSPASFFAQFLDRRVQPCTQRMEVPLALELAVAEAEAGEDVIEQLPRLLGGRRPGLLFREAGQREHPPIIA